MSTYLISNIELVVTVDAGDTILSNTSVLVVDGAIAAIGSEADLAAQSAGAERIDGRRKLLLPGLVNLHTHTPMTLLRGLAEDVDLQGFLRRIWAAEGAVMDPQTVELGAKLGAVESLLGGSTTQLDMYFHHAAGHRGAVAAGSRHVGGPTYMDMTGPDNFTWDQRLSWLDSWPTELREIGGPEVPAMVGPHGTYTVSEPHLRELSGVLAGWQRPLMTIHISENAAENADVQDRFGKSPTELLAAAGGLQGRFPVVFGHGVHMSSADRRLAVSGGAAVAHCPGSNLKLASGALHWDDFKSDSVRLGIGTDGCSTSNDLDMWQAMRMAGLLARLTSGRADTAPAREILRAATIEGARAIGMGDEIGSIEVGKRADLVLIDLDAPHLTPVHDVPALLVFAAGRGDVSDVFVDGRPVVRNRQMTTVDLPALLAAARERGAAAAKAADSA